MDDDDSEEVTLEQGRQQLQLLSRQLQEQKTGDQSVCSSSNRQNLQAERKLLDQKPRGDRLKNRKGSPLGLTLEELDDRGLLDGGGVVPSYYTSLKQKQRRSLELQRRSSRMKHRGQEDEFKTYTLDSLTRMIRVLIRKGVNFEELFQTNDMEGRGVIEKDHFIAIIKEFGLPITSKDLISFSHRYLVTDEHFDYEAFLQDVMNNIEPFVDGEDSLDGQQLDSGFSSFGKVMRDLHRMLNDSKNRLEKSVDDIYRMFSCWDHSGKRTVTSTQFFRVLSQLHVTFSDQEQDFIVELLDTNNEGKINFDALLSYCFDSSTDDDTAQVSIGGSLHHTEGGDESVVSIEGGSTAAASATDVRSISSGNATRRPHTAAAFRSNMKGIDYDKYQDDGDSYTNSFGMSPIGISAANGLSQRGSSPQKQILRRPLTASARVVHNGFNGKDEDVIKNRGEKHIPRCSKNWQRDDCHNFILDISSESDNEDNMPHSSDNCMNGKCKCFNRNMQQQTTRKDINSISVTGNTQDNNSSCYNPNATNDKSFLSKNNDLSVYQHERNCRKFSKRFIIDDEKDYLQNVLEALRSAVIVQHNQHGLTLREVFNLFDKRCIRYIDAGDLMKTSFEFKIDISYEISKAAVQQVAIDGVDRISFSEFAVWITDPEHKSLERTVQMQIAEQLEQQGREYQYLIYRVLSQGEATEMHKSNTVKVSLPSAACGLVSVNSFVEALKTIGLKLGEVDVDRIILRFDTHGSDQCSVSRFMRMAQNNIFWKNAIETLAYHEEAVEEAQVVRQRMHSSNRRAISTYFDDETLDMAEYLGIRVLSEPHLLWIVNEAIKSPLPKDWTIHQDKEGRTFFFNAITKVTRWDHPSDPEIRKLRDFHRKRHMDQSESILSSAIAHEEVRFGNCVAGTTCQNALQKKCGHDSSTQCCQQQDGNSKPQYFRVSDNKGVYDDKTFPSTKTPQSHLHNRNPKINTILLYNNIKAGSKSSVKNSYAPKKTISNYLPKKVTASFERKRAVSAGRQRKKTDADSLRPERNKALDYMYGNHVIEELDLAMQGGEKVERKSGRKKHLQSSFSNHMFDSDKQCYPERNRQECYANDTVWL